MSPPHFLRCSTYIFIIHLCHSQLNQYIESIGPNDESIWESTSDFIPVQGQSFGEVMIGYQMLMEFDFIFHGRTNSPTPNKYEMFFRVGFNSELGNSCEGQGSRYPSLWIKDTSDVLHISSSSTTSCQPSQSLDGYGVLNKEISHHVVISQNNSLLTVHVSGGGKSDYTQSWSRTPTLSHHVRSIVPVWWMSTKYGETKYNRANGTFSNIKIVFSDFGTTTSLPPSTAVPSNEPSTVPTFIPTDVPTANPTEVPSTSPSLSPSGSSTVEPTESPTVSPTVSPSVSPSKSPSESPSKSPTVSPSPEPTTLSPSLLPTNAPSDAPIYAVEISENIPITTDLVKEEKETNPRNLSPSNKWYRENSLFLMLGGMAIVGMCCCILCVSLRSRQKAMWRKKSMNYEVAWAYTPGNSDSAMIYNADYVNGGIGGTKGRLQSIQLDDHGSSEEEMELDSVQTDQCSHIAQFESPRGRNHKSTFEQEMNYVVDCNESLMGHVVDDMVSSIQAKTVLGTLESQTEEL